MIAVFKRRDGWKLRKVMPEQRPHDIYILPFLNSLEPNLFEDAGGLPFQNITQIRFYLVDFWRNKKGEYIKAFYEEI